MKIISLEIQNFKPFRNLILPQDGELPDGLIIIKGPNSTGKSSLFEAILWALWGPTVVTLTNDELVSFASSFCKVILTFEVSGHRYKIERSYDSASGMNVILYLKNGTTWKRVADKTRTVETEIESILNISSKQALNTLLVRQGEVALIANATPSVLRDMLVEVYNLALLDKMEGQLRNLESDLDNRYNALQSDYTNPEYIETQIRKAKIRISDQQEELASKKKDLSEATKALKKFPDSGTLDKLSALQDKIDKLNADIERTTRLRDTELQKDKGLLSPDEKLVLARMASLKKRSQQIEETKEQLKEQISEIDFEVGSLLGEGKRLQKATSTLEASEVDAKCPTCSKPMTEDEKREIIKEYKKTIKSAISRADELKDKRQELLNESREADDKKLEYSRLIDAINRVLELQREVEASQALVASAQDDLTEALKETGIKNLQTLLKKHESDDISDLHRKLTRAEASFENLENEFNTIEKSIEDEQKRIEQLEQDIVTMKNIGADIDNLKSLREHTQYVRRKLVSGFLADYVIQKRLIGIIRGATNPYVRSFTNDQYSGVDLIPTKASGRGGAGILLKIQDKRDNATKKSSQLSYGDRTAISLALRLGISRTMSSIRPLKDSPAISPRIRCVLLDEPLGGLDKQRRTAVVQNLLNDQSFKQILLITHTDVQAWEGVPVIDVSKTGTASSAVLQAIHDNE